MVARHDERLLSGGESDHVVGAWVGRTNRRGSARILDEGGRPSQQQDQLFATVFYPPARQLLVAERSVQLFEEHRVPDELDTAIDPASQPDTKSDAEGQRGHVR